MILTDFDYARPDTLDEAVGLLATEGSRLLAGGQSLLADLRTGDDTAHLLVDIRSLRGLAGTRAEDGRLHVGALTTLADLAADPAVRAAAPALAAAALANGDPQVRNMGTVGGNLSARGRATDLPVAAIAAGATVHLAGPRGRSTMAAEAFAASGPPPRAVVTSLEVPADGRAHAAAFEKVPDRATRYPVCAVAVWVDLDSGGTVSGSRIAVTGATAAPVRLRGVEERLRGGDLRTRTVLAAFRDEPRERFVPGRGASAEYLGHLAGVLTARALARAVA